MLTLLIIGILYLIRQKKICRDKFDKTDPYLSAIPDKRNCTFLDNEGTDLSDLSKPTQHADYLNEYTTTTADILG